MATVSLWSLDILFLVALIALPVKWFAAPFSPVLHIGPLAVPIRWGVLSLCVPLIPVAGRILVMTALRARGLRAEGALERLIFKKICLAVVSPFIMLLAFEQCLELVGYEAVFAPIVVQGETTAPHGMGEFVEDRELFWRLKPGSMFRGIRVNSAGFRDREFPTNKPPGTVRVVCMGDSCTAGGSPPYATLLDTRLSEAPPDDRKWEAFNAACYGYSAVQGLRLLKRVGLSMQPDIVTFYYGWNDHLISGHGPDKTKAVGMGKWQALCLEVLRRKRFGQFLVQHFSPAMRSSMKVRDVTDEEVHDSLRVPPADYEWALNELIEAAHAMGAKPLLITAPSSGRFAEHLVARRSARSLEDFASLHEAYMQITRRVAAETGTELLDLAGEMSGDGTTHLFTGDGIHLTQEGLEHVAATLQGKLSSIAAEYGER